ncbi:MAG: ATPase [Clostridiales bacterium]|nr:ATPase [Clostridiales bacterium]
MDILDLLEVLEDELESGSSMPFTGKTLINSEHCLNIIRDIRLNLPDEIKQSQWIKREKDRILIEAQKEAELILKETKEHRRQLIEENEITQRAYDQSREILESAQAAAKEIRLGARYYADKVLEEVESYIKQQLEIVMENRSQLSNMKK